MALTNISVADAIQAVETMLKIIKTHAGAKTNIIDILSEPMAAGDSTSKAILKTLKDNPGLTDIISKTKNVSDIVSMLDNVAFKVAYTTHALGETSMDIVSMDVTPLNL